MVNDSCKAGHRSYPAKYKCFPSSVTAIKQAMLKKKRKVIRRPKDKVLEVYDSKNKKLKMILPHQYTTDQIRRATLKQIRRWMK